MNSSHITKLVPGEILWDGGSKNAVKGLHLRAFAEKKVFYLYYRTKAGTQRRPKIGEFGPLNIEEAREIARMMLLKVATGGDPSLEKQDLRDELTVSQLFSLTLKEHWSKTRFVKSKHKREVERLYQTHIAPFFSGYKISELKASKVREWHMHFEHMPYAGNRSLDVLSKMFSFAEEKELKPQHTNPCLLVARHPEKKRDRFATDHELKRIGAVLESEWAAHPREVTFIYLLMFTGARPSAIERAEFQGSDVIKVEGKTGIDEVHISPSALEALFRLEQKVGKSKTLTGIDFPRGFWERVREKAGCRGLWARDLRRTFATIAMSDGHDMATVSELLNHKSAQTTKVYAKLKGDARKEIAASTAAKIEELLKG